MVKVGDSLPDVTLFEGAPDGKVDLAKEIGSGSAIIIGVPAAFSPGCTDTHIPGYIAHEKIKSAGKVFVISVNDAFVMKAWGKSLDKEGSSGIRFLADQDGSFTRALDLEFPAAPMLGSNRSKRYAIVIKDGKVKSVDAEPDNIGINVSTAEKILG